MIFLEGSKSLETKFRAMDLEDALKKSKAWIDEKLGGRREERRAANIGTVDGYVEVFKVIKFSKARRLMLVSHRRAEDRKLTAAELADAAGWKTAASATTHYSKLGKEVAERLDLKVDATDKAAWTSTLATLDPATDELQMHEEVALALDALNIG
jgi:predicted metal-dependent hydrolase